MLQMLSIAQKMLILAHQYFRLALIVQQSTKKFEYIYSEVSNKQAGWNKQAALIFLSFLINEQDGKNKQEGYLYIKSSKKC